MIPDEEPQVVADAVKRIADQATDRTSRTMVA
jgi:hypothetical protein